MQDNPSTRCREKNVLTINYNQYNRPWIRQNLGLVCSSQPKLPYIHFQFIIMQMRKLICEKFIEICLSPAHTGVKDKNTGEISHELGSNSLCP